MRKLVCGVGINDAGYVTQRYERVEGKQRRVWICPFYNKWKQMLERTCSDRRMITCPSYADVSVCNEWLTFSSFKSWMETQDWEGKEIDKDLLSSGKKIYSPGTCVFLSRALNNFLLDNASKRGKWPSGVTLNRGRYQSRCSVSVGKGYLYFGCFGTPEEAHEAYRIGKWKLAQEFIALETDQRIIDALIIRFKVEDIK